MLDVERSPPPPPPNLNPLKPIPPVLNPPPVEPPVVELEAEVSDFYPQSSAEIGDEQSGRGVPVAYGSGSSQYVEPPVVELAAEAKEIGFLGVMSGPLVRSSYRAGRLYKEAMAAKSGVTHG